MTINWAHILLREFNNLLKLSFACPQDLMNAAESAVKFATPNALRAETERHRELFALVNSRLNLNRARLQNFIDQAANLGRYFNYQEKKKLAWFFNGNHFELFNAWSTDNGLDAMLNIAFKPITEEDTIFGLHDLLTTGRVNRSDARDCTLEEKQMLIQRALFGAYVFKAFNDAVMHQFFNEEARMEYHANFFDHLRTHHHNQLHRECALIYYDIDLLAFSHLSYRDISDLVMTGIQESYDRLANHCYFAVRLRDTEIDGTRKWRLFSDIVLFAEKHREVMLKKGYFRPDKIQQVTKAYIGDPLDEQKAKFEIASEGFFFRDCYVLSHANNEGTTDAAYDILLLFEKNERDEDVIPCPSCRSKVVSGNSYSVLGVRSWECRNPICPERSTYDRGNRYSLSSIIRQEAITSELDQIPLEVRRRWRHDVVFGVTDHEIKDMLIRHFSLHSDRVVIAGQEHGLSSYLGREIKYENFGKWKAKKGIRTGFFESPFFRRFALVRPNSHSKVPEIWERVGNKVQIICGDCESGLNTLDAKCFDGAVTSPPYYNAREYSQWPNIYCYLYDMYNAALSVFRSLKPGSLYIFNIFDYFDNENIIAFSALGKRRMILGAYIIYLFEKCGFEIVGNVIWFKGSIEGKRNFNQGNTSPYYQLPFNCWEHCLIFRKPGREGTLPKTQILMQRPVIKMVRGKNTHGHTAPFPPEIPNLLIKTMPEDATVLDPYGGSMTTACCAISHGISATSFELEPRYYDLGRRKVHTALNEQP